ncbi:hypothetical protein C8R43DRAFT_886013, partial [Mycena crocata]
QRGKKARVDVEESDDEDEDGYEHAHLKLPKSVLDECEASFQAADEKREKASTQFYDDTALMALLCRHDRVLWLVNMHSAGEKQFNVLLLAEMLFQHLPPKVRVGLLYDIACQLERSARKWGFLERYIDRLTFAVAVFHAFGHDWRCQLLNHPRKRPGFGFTNGEGCERFWHSVSHLIAHLRISSYHHRLYTLDTQVKHADEANLFKLAEWIRRRTLHSANKRVQAEAELRRCGHSREFLREQWKQTGCRCRPGLAFCAGHSQKPGSVCEAAELDAILSGVEEDIIDTKMAAAGSTRSRGEAEEAAKAEGIRAGSVALAELKKARKLKYFDLRMNLSAIYSRMLSRLRAGKFEREAVDRPSRRQGASVKFKLRTHTHSAVQKRQPATAKLNAEYNKLCTQIATEIREKRAPPNAIAPKRIDPKTLFKLEVDDPIWQNAGLHDLEEGQKPPPWLSSETVRSGINAMLEVDRADEEDRILLKEARSMRVWFSEDWRVVNRGMQESSSEPERYQFFLRRERLVRLCATWKKSLPRTDDIDLPSWGPTDRELLECRIQSVTADRGEDQYEARSESSEDEMEDFDTVDSEEAYSASSDSDDNSDLIE